MSVEVGLTNLQLVEVDTQRTILDDTFYQAASTFALTNIVEKIKDETNAEITLLEALQELRDKPRDPLKNVNVIARLIAVIRNNPQFDIEFLKFNLAKRTPTQPFLYAYALEYLGYDKAIIEKFIEQDELRKKILILSNQAVISPEDENLLKSSENEFKDFIATITDEFIKQIYISDVPSADAIIELILTRHLGKKYHKIKRDLVEIPGEDAQQVLVANVITTDYYKKNRLNLEKLLRGCVVVPNDGFLTIIKMVPEAELPTNEVHSTDFTDMLGIISNLGIIIKGIKAGDGLFKTLELKFFTIFQDLLQKEDEEAKKAKKD